jgi:hypothetical protein
MIGTRIATSASVLAVQTGQSHQNLFTFNELGGGLETE